MSNNQIVVDTLLKKRDQLKVEMDAAYAKYFDEVTEINQAIEKLTGKKASEVASITLYDDEHPDYIKQSLEEV